MDVLNQKGIFLDPANIEPNPVPTEVIRNSAIKFNGTGTDIKCSPRQAHTHMCISKLPKGCGHNSLSKLNGNWVSKSLGLL